MSKAISLINKNAPTRKKWRLDIGTGKKMNASDRVRKPGQFLIF